MSASSTWSLEQMIDDLPNQCDIGVKRNAKGHQEWWIGYKLHADVADGGIPISCLLSSGSLYDSQAAIPLATMSAARVTNLYDLMDSAYDAPEIKQRLPTEARAQRIAGYEYPEQRRYRERSTVERFNSRLKEEFGARHLRVRGHAKVLCHLMSGVLVLSADQLLRW